MAFDLTQAFSFLKKNPNTKPHKVVGIDFGSSSLKVVEIEQKKDILVLNTYGELQLGPYAETSMGSVVELSAEKRIEALIDIMRESNVTAKHGVLALPLIDSFVTVINLNAQSDEDISSRVPVEARKYIPVPLSEVTLEWTEVPEEEVPTPDTREVLIAAIQNEALSDMKTLLDAISMVSQPSEIELFSALRSITNETDASIAVIDIGAQMSKLYISENGFIRSIHRIRAGGVQVTQALSQFLGVPFEDAENVKRNYTQNSAQANDIKRIMASVFDRPFQEFKRVINHHEARGGKPITRVVLTGGSSGFYDFVPYANYMFDRNVEVTNPFKKLAYPAFMEDTLEEIAPVFAVALGAALRPFEQ